MCLLSESYNCTLHRLRERFVKHFNDFTRTRFLNCSFNGCVNVEQGLVVEQLARNYVVAVFSWHLLGTRHVSLNEYEAVKCANGC